MTRLSAALQQFTLVISKLSRWHAQVREWVSATGMENLGKKLVNAKEKIEFEKPAMSLEVLMHYGNMLVEEQVRNLAARNLILIHLSLDLPSMSRLYKNTCARAARALFIVFR